VTVEISGYGEPARLSATAYHRRERLGYGEPPYPSGEASAWPGVSTLATVAVAGFESDETWIGLISTDQAHSGTKSAKLIGPANEVSRVGISPALALDGLASLTFWTYGTLALGLPAAGNSIDLKIRLFDATVKKAKIIIPGVVTENTVNDQWVERTVLLADMTVDPGWDGSTVNYVALYVENNVSVKVKTLYVDDITAEVGASVFGQHVTGYGEMRA